MCRSYPYPRADVVSCGTPSTVCIHTHTHTHILSLSLSLSLSVSLSDPSLAPLTTTASTDLGYPGGYFPRDHLGHRDYLDWNGDHPHTNYRDLFTRLRAEGYFIELLRTDFTCFDASAVGTLLLVDTEDEFFPEGIDKLQWDIYTKGSLSVSLFSTRTHSRLSSCLLSRSFYPCRGDH
eukprot:TRINITY_DN5491_c0_g2_i4.p1 TRINITY_DN5491_c0_g2~~TRINITY_DN5491_c0_g2_i4.p1  ORF type:complete len:178 (+),score=27.30 TRINITY_DN5491_c0_g2_i4:231-764(+)